MIFKTPLQIAISEGNYQDVLNLIENGADISQILSKKILPPVHLAIKYKHMDILKLLLNYKANPNLPTSNGVVPLITAINSGNDEAVSILLQYGANPNVVNSVYFHNKKFK